MNKPSSKQSTKIKALTVREEAFIGAYISNGGNGAAAVKTAGYRCKAQGAAKVQAARMLTRANLSAEIAKRRAELRRVSNVGAQEVIAVLAAQMRSDITEFLGKDASFDLERIRSATLGRLIKKLILKRAVPAKRATARNNVQSSFTYVSRVELYSAQSAAIRLCKVLGIEHEKGRTRNGPETLRKLLEERIEFGIEGFRRGGVVLTRRDMLELFSKAPESAGELYPLIQAELASLIQAELDSEETSPMQD